jgi:hypothetical protein
MSLALLALIGALACGPVDPTPDADADADADSDADDAGDADDADPTGDPDCTGTPFPASCDGAIELAPGTTSEVPLTWRYDARCAQSVADVVTVQLDPAPDVLSLTIDASGTPTFVEAALDGEALVTLENDFDGPFRECRSFLSRTIQWPDPSGAPIGSGCLAVRPVALTPASGGLPGRLLVSARNGAGSTLTIATRVVEGTDIDDTELDALLTEIARLLALAGIEVVEADRDIVPWESPEIDVSVERGELLASLEASDAELVLVITGALLDGLNPTIGVAGGISGPPFAGTNASGVAIGVETARMGDSIDIGLLGLAATHEIGHFLGLFHTSEYDGSFHDYLADTAECGLDADANGNGQLETGECPGDAMNVMFWTNGADQETWSPMQITAMRMSTLVR